MRDLDGDASLDIVCGTDITRERESVHDSCAGRLRVESLDSEAQRGNAGGVREGRSGHLL